MNGINIIIIQNSILEEDREGEALCSEEQEI